jgi:hypothetical protein
MNLPMRRGPLPHSIEYRLHPGRKPFAPVASARTQRRRLPDHRAVAVTVTAMEPWAEPSNGRKWWAQVELTRMNIELTFLRNEIV